MTTAEAHAKLAHLSAEVYRIKLDRWHIEYPPGHGERDDRRPRAAAEAPVPRTEPYPLVSPVPGSAS